MIRALMDFVHRIPVAGNLIHRAWLVAFRHEGQVFEVQAGALQGTRMHRFRMSYTDTYLTGDYELPSQKAMIASIKPGQVVYDLGANGGFLTLLAAKLVGPSGKVIAFEPTRETARMLRAQLRLNRADHVTVIQSAVADRVGTTRFVEDGCYMSRVSGMMPGTTDTRTVEVKTTSLDSLAGTIPPPDFLKIDVEGAEILALRGAERLLREHRPTMLVELHSIANSQEFHRLMEQLGYDVSLPEDSTPDPGDYERHVIARPSAREAVR